MKRKVEGFTLIELLVVIAIIAILAAILFPVFLKAKKTAQISTCTSNMRQWAAALMRYTDDHNGHYPFAGASLYAGCARYHTPKPLGQGMGGSATCYIALKRYVGNSEQLRWCPLARGVYQAQLGQIGWSYWYYCGHGHGNGAGYPNWQLCGLPTSIVRAPSKKPSIGELATNHSMGSPEFAMGHKDITAPANLAYCDGHVTTRVVNYEDQLRYTYADYNGKLP